MTFLNRTRSLLIQAQCFRLTLFFSTLITVVKARSDKASGNYQLGAETKPREQLLGAPSFVCSVRLSINLGRVVLAKTSSRVCLCHDAPRHSIKIQSDYADHYS